MGTGGGVSNPNFAGYAQANVANTDYSGLVENQYNQQNQQYMQKVQQQGSALGGIFGTLGSLGSTAGSIWSDRRLKANIKAIGELASGIKTYVFNYIWDSTVRFGVMADEVINVKPEAVDITNGYMTVDYGRIW
jgi:hypothetical protein